MANRRKTEDTNEDDVMQMELMSLVGMQKGTVTLENWQFLMKLKIPPMIWQVY